MDLRVGVSPQEFPRIAKEMGFGFSLRRGRVDWNRIDSIDVDRMVQERDLMKLQDNLINIINYNLDNEYDVKILDPNFVKLFRLAQLSVDYLMYSEQHLYNCVELLQHELTLSVKEIERLKQECKKREDDLRNMKKQLKERDKKLSAAHDYHYHHSQLVPAVGTEVPQVFKCSHCGKAFVSGVYLEAHHTRRHASLLFAPPVIPVPQEVEQLQVELKALRERLLQTEDKENVPNNAKSKPTADEKHDEKKEWEEEYKRKMDEWERRYQEELAALRNLFIMEVKSLKEPSKELLDILAHKDQEIALLREQLSQQSLKEPSKELLDILAHKDQEIALLREKLSQQASPLEGQWQERLSALEEQHLTAVAELRDQLLHAQEEGKQQALIKSEYEHRIEELVSRLASQDKQIRGQGDQIRQLSEQKAKSLVEQNLAPRLQRSTSREFLIPASPKEEDSPMFRIPTQPITEAPPMFRIPTHPITEVPSAATVLAQWPATPVTTIATIDPQQREPEQEDSSTSSSPSEEPTRLYVQPRRPSPIPVKSKPLSREKSNKWQGMDEEASPVHRNRREMPTYSEVRTILQRPTEDEVDHEGVSEESEGSESWVEEEEEDSVQDKTLALHSINSMEDVLAQNPHILSELRHDLQAILERRLRELAVDPEWEGIPSATFAQKMSTLQHHQSITAKRLRSYFRTRQQLVEEVERRVLGVKVEDRQSVPSKPGTVLNKFVSSVRQKAKSVFKHPRTGKPPPSVNETYRQDRKSADTKTVQKSIEPPAESRNPRTSERTEGQASGALPVKMVTSTPTKKVVPGTVKGMVPVLNRGALDSELDSARTETTANDSSFSSEEESPVVAPVAVRRTAAGFTEVVLESPAGSKSNLKSTAVSTGSLTKKRVLFAEHDDVHQISDTGNGFQSSTLPRPAKVGAITRKLSASDELPTGDDTARHMSWGSPDRAKTVKFAQPLKSKVSQLGQDESDSDSDWEEVSDETSSRARTDTASAGSASQINLSTRQSDKIAQISKSIEKQLNLARMKPVGGVEAMFAAGPVPSAATTAPIAKPRCHLTTATAPTPVTQQTLSDWDLEDFDD